MLRVAQFWAPAAPMSSDFGGDPRERRYLPQGLCKILALAPTCCFKYCRDQFVWPAALLTWCGGEIGPATPAYCAIRVFQSLACSSEGISLLLLPERAWVDAPSPARVRALHSLEIKNGARRPIAFLSVWLIWQTGFLSGAASFCCNGCCVCQRFLRRHSRHRLRRRCAGRGFRRRHYRPSRATPNSMQPTP